MEGGEGGASLASISSDSSNCSLFNGLKLAKNVCVVQTAGSVEGREAGPQEFQCFGLFVITYDSDLPAFLIRSSEVLAKQNLI